MTNSPGDEFIPAGIDPPSWLAFEGRVQERRFRSLVEKIGTLLDQGHLASARVALAEARTLRPEAPELSALEARLAGRAGGVWRGDFQLWKRVIAGSGMLLAGVSLLLIAESSRGSNSAPPYRGEPTTAISASGPTAIRENGRDLLAAGAGHATSSAGASGVSAPTGPVTSSAPPAAAVRPSRDASLDLRRRGVPRLVATTSQPLDAAGSPASPSRPSLTGPLVTLRVTSTTPTEGALVSLTVLLTLPTGGAAPRVTVDWGDGTTEDIGIVPAARTVTHAYATAGAYTITASATPDGDSSAAVWPASMPRVVPNVGSVRIGARIDHAA